MRSFQWYLNRLKGMSVSEVVARVTHGLARKAGLLAVPQPPPTSSRISSSWLHAGCPARPEPYIWAADQVISGKAPVFALKDFEFSAAREWNRDPLTGVVAPLKDGHAIDVHSRSVVGDIKYLWEPNRHLDLVVLAQAFSLTNDQKYLREITKQLDSWFEQCPYLKGPNWVSGLELGIRLINWSVIWQLIGAENSHAFNGQDGQGFRDRWVRSIYQHIHFIRSNYSRYSSANNHLIGEAAGVFVAACTWPYWKEVIKWGEQSRQLLVGAASSQTHADGVNREQALSYQQFVLDFFILAGLAGRACGYEFPGSYWRTIEQMIEFIHSIMDVGGNVPMTGDGDDGFVVRLSRESEFCPYRSLLATGAILFSRSEFAAKGRVLDDKTRYLLGDDSWKGLTTEPDKESSLPLREFPQGGYYILGQDFDTADEIRMLVDAGPLGYLSIAAHGHADALSLCLSVAGREFLIDPGTYTYHGKPEWRAYFRGSRAHNTVTIDGQDQSVQGGNFMWTRHARAQCIEFSTGPAGEKFTGQHDGYERLADPVIHERQIIRNGPSFDIIDKLVCRGSHRVDRCWHFSEECKVHVSNNQVHAENGGIRICLAANDPQTEIVSLRGSNQPIGGWISRSFDVKTASTSVYFLNRVNGTTSFSASIQCYVK